MAATCLKKSGDRAIFPTVQHPLFFTQQSVNIWELRRPVVGSLGEECCHIVVRFRNLAARQSLSYFVFHNEMLSVDETTLNLNSRQVSPASGLFYYEAMLCFRIVFLK